MLAKYVPANCVSISRLCRTYRLSQRCVYALVAQIKQLVVFKNILVWIEMHVLIATISDEDGPTSVEK